MPHSTAIRSASLRSIRTVTGPVAASPSESSQRASSPLTSRIARTPCWRQFAGLAQFHPQLLATLIERSGFRPILAAASRRSALLRPCAHRAAPCSTERPPAQCDTAHYSDRQQSGVPAVRWRCCIASARPAVTGSERFREIRITFRERTTIHAAVGALLRNVRRAATAFR